jgi:hypothetical protein
MHVLHRPHLPHPIRVSLVAAVLAVAISTALAAGINTSNESGSSNGPARLNAPYLTGRQTRTGASRPLDSLVGWPQPLRWLAARPSLSVATPAPSDPRHKDLSRDD